MPPRTMQPTLVSSTRQAFDSRLEAARVAPLDIQQHEFAAHAAPLSGPPLSRHHAFPSLVASGVVWTRWFVVDAMNLLRPLVRTALRARSLRQSSPQQIKHGVVDRDMIRTTNL